MNSPTAMTIPRATETPMMSFFAVSPWKWALIHLSSLSSWAACSSSGSCSAEYISAFTPCTRESKKFTTPRIRGTPRTGYRSFTSFSSSTLRMSPSCPRHTMASFLGPRMRMPSISACPPMLVRKPQLSFLFLAMDVPSYLSVVGSRMVTSAPGPSWALAISSTPSCRRMISSHTARPMPLPLALLLPL